MRIFDLHVAMSRKLIRADADMLDCLTELRRALRKANHNPDAPQAQGEAEIRRDNFLLALSLRDDIADQLDLLPDAARESIIGPAICGEV